MHKVLSAGFVKLIDTMGDDKAVVDAARISYGEGTKKVSDDKNLIRYLMRHGHMTPFEQNEIKLHIKLPIDVMRQLVRYRAAHLNEISSRYSVVGSEMETAKTWRLQSTNNKQGSEGILSAGEGIFESRREEDIHKLCKETYDLRLKKGIAREQARKDLPLCTYTEVYWKIDLRNLFNFLNQRLDSHAQYEIRQYAEAIAKITKEWVPISYEAFEDYILNAVHLSSLDAEIIKHLNLFRLSREDWDQKTTDLYYEFHHKLDTLGWLKEKNRERDECETKLIKLGFNNNDFIWRK